MLEFTVHTDIDEVLRKEIDEAALKAEIAAVNQIEKDTRPFVPMLTGSLVQRTTTIDQSYIIYPGPYARYLYYGKVMKGPLHGPKYATDKNLVYTKQHNAQAQSHWFEASKAQNLDKWLRTADKAVIHYLKRK